MPGLQKKNITKSGNFPSAFCATRFRLTVSAHWQKHCHAKAKYYPKRFLPLAPTPRRIRSKQIAFVVTDLSPASPAVAVVGKRESRLEVPTTLNIPRVPGLDIYYNFCLFSSKRMNHIPVESKTRIYYGRGGAAHGGAVGQGKPGRRQVVSQRR